MNAKEMTKFLEDKQACSEGMKWGRGKSLKEIWDTCNRPDWMMWLYKYLSPKKKKALKVAIYSAELVLPIFEKQYPNDKRPREAIESAKRVLKNDTQKNRDLASAHASVYAYASAHAHASAYAYAYAYAYASVYAYAFASASAYASAHASVYAYAFASASAYAFASASAFASKKRDAINKKICSLIRKLIKVSELKVTKGDDK